MFWCILTFLSLPKKAIPQIIGFDYEELTGLESGRCRRSPLRARLGEGVPVGPDVDGVMGE
jgi:hypothetical protein